MAIVIAPSAPVETLGDLLNRLGGISPDRVLCDPSPGRATEEDVVRADVHSSRLCELIDGTLVEKAMGFNESLLAGALISLLRAFVIPRNLGMVSGEAGMMRILPGLVRIPDVAFISWKRVPGGRPPDDAILPLAPNLAVEILSEGNTADEMARKRNEYFAAGVELLWEIDPRKRTVTVFTNTADGSVLSEAQTVDGGDVLPGFALALNELFGELDRVGPQ